MPDCGLKNVLCQSRRIISIIIFVWKRYKIEYRRLGCGENEMRCLTAIFLCSLLCRIWVDCGCDMGLVPLYSLLYLPHPTLQMQSIVQSLQSQHALGERVTPQWQSLSIFQSPPQADIHHLKSSPFCRHMPQPHPFCWWLFDPYPFWG
jgi:hypothetical protein